jgi:hypothetical protein
MNPNQLSEKDQRLFKFAETLLTIAVVNPILVEHEQLAKPTPDERKAHFDAKIKLLNQFNHSTRFWDILNGDLHTNSNIVDILKLVSCLIYLESCIEDYVYLINIKKLLEYKLKVPQDMMEEYLTLCVDLRCLIYHESIGTEEQLLKQEEFFQAFPPDGLLTLDQEQEDFFRESLERTFEVVNYVKGEFETKDIFERFHHDVKVFIANLFLATKTSSSTQPKRVIIY